MACGIGVCMTCVLPVIGSDDKTRMVRSCVDGPVFAGDRIRLGRPRHGARTDAIGVANEHHPAPRRDAVRHSTVDMTTTLGNLTVPDPGVHRVRMRARRPGAGAVQRPGRRSARRHQVDPDADPRPAAPTPRMAETPSGMLNSIGLQGPGIDVFIKRDLGWLDEHGVRAVVSIAATTVDDYGKLASKLRSKPLAMIEVNISLPERRGPRPGLRQRPPRPRGRGPGVRRASADPARRSSPSSRRTSPTSSRSPGPASTPARPGCADQHDCLAWSSTPTRCGPTLAGVTGGLSGPAIRPVALRCVWQVHEALPDVPLFGMGGIRTGLDALAVHPGRCERGAGRHGDLQRPRLTDPGVPRASRCAGGPRHGPARARRSGSAIGRPTSSSPRTRSRSAPTTSGRAAALAARR